MSIKLKKTMVSDIPKLLEIEKSVAGQKTYSPMLEENEWVEDMGKESVFLIENNRVVVGNISYQDKGEGLFYISGLAVMPQYQGRGFAKEAMLKILEKLKSAKRTYLVTHPDNKIALKLYQSLGFSVESRKENYFGDGEPRLTLVLQVK